MLKNEEIGPAFTKHRQQVIEQAMALRVLRVGIRVGTGTGTGTGTVALRVIEQVVPACERVLLEIEDGAITTLLLFRSLSPLLPPPSAHLLLLHQPREVVQTPFKLRWSHDHRLTPRRPYPSSCSCSRSCSCSCSFSFGF